MSEILVREMRGNVVENVHRGHIVVVDEKGQVLRATGDPAHITYLRSSGKPIQALPAVMSGIARKFGLTDRELSLLAASHRGESFHIEALDSMKQKLGLTDEHLLCSPTYPLNPATRDELLKKGQTTRRMYHNCSGKHLGMMALCKSKGYPLEGYYEPEHPVQQEILHVMSVMTGCKPEEIGRGVDGCGVPVFAMPLRNLAHAFLKLGCPELIEDIEMRKAADQITRAMNAYPEMISGTDAICTQLLMDANIVAKGGAQGVYCFGLRQERLGFALKIMDGSSDEWPLIIASILEQIGYQNQATIDRLYQIANQEIVNDNKRIVGRNEACFTLASR
ncbi:asparaginase [Paenibacillus albiflavus]|uniref:Asparaginase n=1 Tax=Paenibacillus albiflavus TaxID=2545760 RepID=A0A4R4E0C4_9BACL|nr:asparaginase [Paenibacillus albiflavus]TCZ72854.1 asparaginase [Paenibacillus albiflavus]